MITCAKCKLGFDPGVEPGAILLSPPLNENEDPNDWLVSKLHLCQACWDRLKNWLRRI